MRTRYRVAVFTGPDGSSAHQPCKHLHLSLLGALKCYVAHQREGHGVALQIRLMPGEPWRWIPAAHAERYREDYRLE